ncbi:MAG: putative lipopolysaccharide heptosyltransferase III [Pseudomonadota bacterium]|nr:putative lipopolysaccharide heptosyltransferase III [Pseudomonadota bacterium]MDP1903403.1 putative lipopolysaccharide heptosyltransferase III [Pseudomonadota bacterium]MDP2352373.1 putative lipopolysaccharide heptosyltransferase III [Pseudomonadota bacterium]
MSPDAPLDLSRVRRVLVTKLRHHGDVLLASPVLGALKRHLPEAEIDALVYHDTRDMLEGHPALSRLHTTRRRASLAEDWRLLKDLRTRHYDLLVHLTTNPRGAALARLLRPPLSIGLYYGGRFYRNSFTHLYKNVNRNRRHTVENNLDALRCLGIHIDEEDKRLTLVPGTAAEQIAVDHLQRLGLATGNFILIHPTSRWLFKCWSEEKVADLAEQLAQLGHAVLFTSGPDAQEINMIARIQARLARPAPSLAGQLSLKELAALIARARAFVGVDSAPMHIAAAVATPVVALFGPSGELDWGPWRVTSRVITSEHTCRPCGLDGCGGSKRSECLEAITVARVLRAIQELL